MTKLRTIPSLAALALLALTTPPALAQAPGEPALVTVSGVGVIRRAPDVAYVVLVAQSRNVSPAVAQASCRSRKV